MTLEVTLVDPVPWGAAIGRARLTRRDCLMCRFVFLWPAFREIIFGVLRRGGKKLHNGNIPRQFVNFPRNLTKGVVNIPPPVSPPVQSDVVGIFGPNVRPRRTPWYLTKKT